MSFKSVQVFSADVAILKMFPLAFVTVSVTGDRSPGTVSGFVSTLSMRRS